MEDKIANSKEYFSRDYYFGHKNSNYLNYFSMDTDKYWEFITEAIKRYKMKGRILDIGCAFGFLLKRSRLNFEEAYGIDISDFAIQTAKSQVPFAKLEVLDINDNALPYPDGFFDLVTAIDVLEHTRSIGGSLEKIMPKLKAGGYMIASIPLKDTWGGRLCGFFNADHSHLDVPTEKEILDTVDRIGLDLIEKSYGFNMPLTGRIKFINSSIDLVVRKKV